MNKIKSNNYIEFASPEVKDLYALLEGEIHILMIGKKAGSVLDALRKMPEFEKYISSLETNLIYRALQHASKFYSRVKISTLYTYLSFASKANVNKVLLSSSLNKRLRLKINHSLGIVVFGEDSQKPIDPVVKLLTFAKELKMLVNSLEERKPENDNYSDGGEEIDVQEYIEDAPNRVSSRKEVIKAMKRGELDSNDTKKNVKIQTKKDLKREMEDLIKKEEEAQRYKERQQEERDLTAKFTILKEVLRVFMISNFS